MNACTLHVYHLLPIVLKVRLALPEHRESEDQLERQAPKGWEVNADGMVPLVHLDLLDPLANVVDGDLPVKPVAKASEAVLEPQVIYCSLLETITCTWKSLDGDVFVLIYLFIYLFIYLINYLIT